MLPNPVEDARLDEWTRMIGTNLTGTLRIIRAFVPDLLAAAGSGRPAGLVNVSPIGAHTVFPTYAVHSATKAAVTQSSAALRAELGPRDVRVAAIEPGPTDTEPGEHIDNTELSGALTGMSDTLGGLSAGDVADVIAYVAGRPRHVDLRQVVVLPTRQV